MSIGTHSFFVPVNKSLYAPYAPAPGKAGVPPGRHSVGSARRQRLNRQSSAACLANIRRVRNRPVQHKPTRAREPRVEKSNGMTPVASEKRCISQPVARRPDPDGSPLAAGTTSTDRLPAQQVPRCAHGSPYCPRSCKKACLSSRTERLGVVPKIRTTPSGPLLNEHQPRDRVVPAAARAGPRRTSRRWRRPTPRAPRCTRSLKALPQWWNVSRPTRLSFSKLPVMVRHINSSPKTFFVHHFPAGLSVLVTKLPKNFLC